MDTCGDVGLGDLSKRAREKSSFRFVVVVVVVVVLLWKVTCRRNQNARVVWGLFGEKRKRWPFYSSRTTTVTTLPDSLRNELMGWFLDVEAVICNSPTLIHLPCQGMGLQCIDHGTLE